MFAKNLLESDKLKFIFQDENSHHSFNQGSVSKHSLIDGIWNLKSLKDKSNDGITRWKISKKSSSRTSANKNSLAVKEEMKDDVKHKKSFRRKSKNKHFSFKKLASHKISSNESKKTDEDKESTDLDEQTYSAENNVDEDDIENDAVKLSNFVKKKHPNIKNEDKDNENFAMKGSRRKIFEKKNIKKGNQIHLPSPDKVQQEPENTSNFGPRQADYFDEDEAIEWEDAVKHQESKASRKGSTHIVFADRVAEENSTSSNQNKTVNGTRFSNETLINKTKEGMIFIPYEMCIQLNVSLIHIELISIKR